MSDFVYDGTTLPTGKSNARPLSVPANKGVTAQEWNTAMSAVLSLRDAVLTGVYHGFDAGAGNAKFAMREAEPTDGIWSAGDVVLNTTATVRPGGWLCSVSGDFDATPPTFVVWSVPEAFSLSVGSFGSTPNAGGASYLSGVLTMQPADASHPGMVSTGAQSWSGQKTFADGVTSQVSGGPAFLTGTNASYASDGAVRLTSQDTDGGSAIAAIVDTSTAWSTSGAKLFVWKNNGVEKASISRTGTLTTAGAVTATGAVTGSNLSGTNTGDIILAPFGSAPSSSGSSLDATVNSLTLQPADATHPGGVSIGTQTFAGAKTFAAALSSSVASGSNSINLLDGARLNLSTADTSAYLYRSASNTIRTPGNIVVDGYMQAAPFTALYAAANGFSGGFLNAAATAYRVIVNKSDTGLNQTHSSGTWGFGSTTGNQSGEAADTAISRVSAGVLGIGTGAAGSIGGSLSCATVTTSGIVTVGGELHPNGARGGMTFQGTSDTSICFNTAQTAELRWTAATNALTLDTTVSNGIIANKLTAGTNGIVSTGILNIPGIITDASGNISWNGGQQSFSINTGFTASTSSRKFGIHQAQALVQEMSSANSGSGAVCVAVGANTSDAGTNAAAKLLSIGTGLNGGTYVEKAYVTKPGYFIGSGFGTAAGSVIQLQNGEVLNFSVADSYSYLYRVNANTLSFGDGINSQVKAGSLTAGTTAGSAGLYLTNVGALIYMGGADATATLVSPATGIIKASGKLTAVAGLGVGNSASATIAVGTLANKMEVFDASGSSLGFVPIYATIT